MSYKSARAYKALAHERARIYKKYSLNTGRAQPGTNLPIGERLKLGIMKCTAGSKAVLVPMLTNTHLVNTIIHAVIAVAISVNAVDPPAQCYYPTTQEECHLSTWCNGMCTNVWHNCAMGGCQ